MRRIFSLDRFKFSDFDDICKMRERIFRFVFYNVFYKIFLFGSNFCILNYIIF